MQRTGEPDHSSNPHGYMFDHKSLSFFVRTCTPYLGLMENAWIFSHFKCQKWLVFFEKVCQYRDNEDRPFLRPLLKYHWCQMIFIKIAINMTLQKSQFYISMWLLNNKLLWITKGYFGPLSFSKCNIYLSNLNVFMVWKKGSFTDNKFDN